MFKFKVTCYTEQNTEFSLTIHADDENQAKAKAEKMVDARCIGKVTKA